MTTELVPVGRAFLSATLQVAFERLASSEILDYFRRRKLNDGVLKKLHMALLSINQVLDDAEEKQYGSLRVKIWLNCLKDAVFEAEDLLEVIATEASRQKLDAEFQASTSKVRGFFTTVLYPFEKEIESRIQKVLDVLEFLAKQKDELGLKDGSSIGTDRGVGGNRPCRLPTTSSLHVYEPVVVGRESDKQKIIEMLLSHNINSNQSAVDMISIVGMGGLGKTTLAQLVYNDESVKYEFDLRVWVLVSDKFDVLRLTKSCLEALARSPKDSKDITSLQMELKMRLKGKKFLLVLDDVWNEDYTIWEAFQFPFTYGSTGSKILVTTRSEIVALVIQSAYVHRLRPLTEEESWYLFARYAFIDHFNGRDSNLASIGKEIVRKCEGLPIAIRTLGGLLRSQLSEEVWVNILESHLWDYAQEIIPALILSYHYLPSHVKQCFLCSIFPESYVIDKEVLIQTWAAHGFLRSYQEGQSIKEVGNEIFNELVSRSFFEPSSSNRFMMHDLVYDLAKSMVPSFSESVNFKNLSYGILNFRKICYLDISCTSIKELPNSICLLYKLQTLILRGCHNLTVLPSKFHQLFHLQYLDLYGTRIKQMPQHTEKLEQLYILFSYIVGKNRGSDMKELEKLNHLRGRLLILKLENVINPVHAKESSMKDKKNLEELTLGWSRKCEDSQLAMSILESLQPNCNLQKLNVNNYNGTRFPNWFDALHLPNLVSLRLRGNDNCSYLPPLGMLPSLKQLRISGFHGVKDIGLEFYGRSSSSSVPFRSLELLLFADMRQWEEWDVCFEGESFPCLQYLEISNCPRIRKSLPQYLPCLTKLHIVECKNLEATRPKVCAVAQQS